MKHYMLLRALLCALLVPFCAWAQGWTWLNPWPQGNTLRDFFNRCNEHDWGAGWAVGDNGTLLAWDCSYFHWRPPLSHEDLQAVAMTDQNHVWMVGNGGNESVIYRTTNGGQLWTIQFFDSNAHLYDVAFTDNLRGWVVGDKWSADTYDAIVGRTTDGGRTWMTDTVGTHSYAQSLCVLDSLHLWVGGYNCLARSTDGGLTWQILPEPPDDIIDLVFTDSLNGFIGSIEYIYVTHDGGLSWQPHSPYLSSWVTDLEFVGSNLGWAACGNGMIYHTTNGGQTWNPQSSGTQQEINSIRFFNATDGQAMGEGGVMLWTNDGGASWHRRDSNVAEGVNLDHVSCAPGDQPQASLWTLGQNDSGSVILHSEDGGRNWARQHTAWTHAFRDVAAVGADSAFLVGDGGGIFMTTDGGQHWLPQFSRTTLDLWQVCFVNSRVGWVNDGNGRLLHTRNGGERWDTLPNQGPWWTEIDFVNENVGWMAGSWGSFGGSQILHTTDGGLTWDQQFTSSDTAYYALFFINELNGWVGGYRNYRLDTELFPALMHTTDGGATWHSQTIAGLESGDVRQIVFRDTQHGRALTYEGIFATEDGGENWYREQTPTGYGVSALATNARHEAWAVGYNGMILHWAGTTSVNLPHTVLPQKFALAVFPNPFNPRTTIRFDLPTSSQTELLVFDVTGRLVARLLNGRINAGAHEIAFDASTLSSGIYFAHLHSGTLRTTQKLVLLK